MLIIEGSDLAGKTTLVNQIVHEMRSEGDECVLSLHMGCPKPGETELGNLLKQVSAEYREVLTSDLVLDRFLLGDFAYRTVWPRPFPLTGQQYQALGEWLWMTDSHVIMLLPPEDVIRARYAVRGDEFVSLENILIAARRYELFCDTVGSAFPMTVVRDGVLPDQLVDQYMGQQCSNPEWLRPLLALETDLEWLQIKFADESTTSEAQFERLDVL
jgi:GTPase SAR1 family protein